MGARITTYLPLPIAITYGKGIWVYDELGNCYLDSYSGIAVNGLGHAHPDIVRTIQEQAAKVIHVSNGIHIRQQEALAERLTELSGTSQAFFSNSGAEANESAFKLARLYGHRRGVETPTLIVMEQAFHGRTLAALSASGSRKIQAGFEPLVSGFLRAPFNDLEAISRIVSHREDVVGVMLEPIQGEAGVIPADESYLRALATFCREKEWLLILDEIQTGNGRTGSYFAYMSLGIQPDVVTTAKGLANGIPIGACLIGERVKDLFKPGNHGSTFGGNPLACAVALTVLDVIERDQLCLRAHQLGVLLQQALQQAFEDVPMVRAIRGKGLMIGIECDRPLDKLKTVALKHGLLLNITNERVIRLLPALIMTDEEAHELVGRLVQTVKAFLLDEDGA
ncbi:MAG: aspartate aminotransferase family protein [Gammaproteobacteria bacterium]|nr:aspartate aminotransferase family protein [Gammaproteobacteria bacterium]